MFLADKNDSKTKHTEYHRIHKSIRIHVALQAS